MASHRRISVRRTSDMVFQEFASMITCETWAVVTAEALTSPVEAWYRPSHASPPSPAPRCPWRHADRAGPRPGRGNPAGSPGVGGPARRSASRCSEGEPAGAASGSGSADAGSPGRVSHDQSYLLHHHRRIDFVDDLLCQMSHQLVTDALLDTGVRPGVHMDQALRADHVAAHQDFRVDQEPALVRWCHEGSPATSPPTTVTPSVCTELISAIICVISAPIWSASTEMRVTASRPRYLERRSLIFRIRSMTSRVNRESSTGSPSGPMITRPCCTSTLRSRS